jgi:hypothetical protein
MTDPTRRLVFGLLSVLALLRHLRGLGHEVMLDVPEEAFTTDNLLVKATVRMSKTYIGPGVLYPGSAPLMIDFDHGEGWDKLEGA